MTQRTLAQLRSGEAAGASVWRMPHRDGEPQLTQFPEELLALADTLEVLDLSGHALRSLPPSLSRFTRLTALFASYNQFDHLPEVLGDLPALSQVGFRNNQIRHVSGNALPARLRWLTLTDNRLGALPIEIGQRPLLEKVGLAGNRLQALPDSLADAARLGLFRVSANQLTDLPGWLSELPELAWLGWGGNPADRQLERPAPHAPDIAWQALELGELLGQGASGLIHRAVWRQPDGQTRDVAVKLFKGTMTSDGLPDEEMAASLAASGHPTLMAAIGRLKDHPDGTLGLVMPLLPEGWRVLAGPPSLASCSRDVYDPTLRLPLHVAVRIAADVGLAGAHLHGLGLVHGDFYAHNTLWDGVSGRALLSDLGAACFVPPGMPAHQLQRVEVRAWGLLLGEVLACVEGAVPAELSALQAACVQPAVQQRPLLADAVAALRPWLAG